MEKNIFVTDEFGNVCGMTYPRRARGLVKNERARWVDGQTICLRRSPYDNMEDTMEQLNQLPDEVMETAPDRPAADAGGASRPDAGYTAQDILARIDTLLAARENAPDYAVLIAGLPVNEAPDGGQDGAARAQAIEAISRTRAEENKAILTLLQAMYRDLQ